MQSVVIHHVTKVVKLDDNTVKMTCNLLEGVFTEVTFTPNAINNITVQEWEIESNTKEQNDA